MLKSSGKVKCLRSSLVFYTLVHCAASYIVARPLSACHSNQEQLTEVNVVRRLAEVCDRNGNGVIQDTEIVVGFMEVLDISLPLPEQTMLAMNYDTLMGLGSLSGYTVTRQDFVEGWHDYFHDNVDFIGAVFDRFDDNNDGSLSIVEIDGILSLLLDTVDDGDGHISESEFSQYFLDMFRDC